MTCPSALSTENHFSGQFRAQPDASEVFRLSLVELQSVCAIEVRTGQLDLAWVSAYF